MNTVLVALLMLPLAQAPAEPPKGDPAAGQKQFGGGASFCTICHGGKGQGAFGPDLAGRGLSFAQFKRAITEPYGIMPSFRHLDDKAIADMHAYLEGLPKVAKAGEAGNPPPPPGSPLGQHLFLTIGCGQCHRNEAADPRRDMGAFGKEMTFELFQKIVYEGERRAYAIRTPAPRRMGVWSKDHLPEPVMRVIYDWLTKETGLRVPMTAEMTAPVVEGANTKYTLHVENEGDKVQGLVAEGATISLVLPEGAKVVSTTGAGYKGVRMDAERKGNVAEWKVAKILPGEKQEYSITLAGTAPMPKGAFTDSRVEWEKPEIRRPANQTLKDNRIPDKPGFKGDWISTVGVAQRPDGRVLPLFILPPAK
jgi:cytochrome c553